MGGGGGGYTGNLVSDPRLMPKQKTNQVERKGDGTNTHYRSNVDWEFFINLNDNMHSPVSSTTGSWLTVCDISGTGGMLGWYVSRNSLDGPSFQARITVDGTPYTFNSSDIPSGRFVLGAGYQTNATDSDRTEDHFDYGIFEDYYDFPITTPSRLQVFPITHMQALGMPLLRWESSLKIEEICDGINGGGHGDRAVAYYELDSCWS